MQGVLGELLTFSHYPSSLIYSVSSSVLQTEALEEFLSILRPSFLRKPRSLTTKPRHRLDVTSDHYRLPRPHNITCHSRHTCWCTLVLFFPSLCVLGHSDDHSPAPSALSAPLTPAAVPLPLPTPDELVDNVLFGIMGTDWRLWVCWLLVLRQVFVELMCFGGDGLRISYRMEVLRGYEWKKGRWVF